MMDLMMGNKSIEIINTKIETISLLCESLEEKNRIKKAKKKIQIEEINKFNPMLIGDKAIGNYPSYSGKIFLIEDTFIGSINKTDLQVLNIAPMSIDDTPIYFIASGRLFKNDGSLSDCKTSRAIRIDSVIDS